MSTWINSATGAQINVPAGQGIEADGTYYLARNRYNPAASALFGAQVKAAGHTATVQLFAECAGAKVNIGSPIVPTNGSPAMFPDEITLTGGRGIVVTGLTGIVYPEVTQ